MVFANGCGSVAKNVGGHRHHVSYGVPCTSVDWNPYSAIGFVRQCGCTDL